MIQTQFAYLLLTLPLFSLMRGHWPCSIIIAYKHSTLSLGHIHIGHIHRCSTASVLQKNKLINWSSWSSLTAWLRWLSLFPHQLPANTHGHPTPRCTVKFCVHIYTPVCWPVNWAPQHLAGAPWPEKPSALWSPDAGWLQPRSISHKTLDTSRSSHHIR